MALPGWTTYNKIKRAGGFEVEAFVCAFTFDEMPYFEPYYEKYDFSQIFLILDGEGIYTTEGVDYKFASGEMFYRPSNTESIYRWVSEGCRFAVLSFVCNSPQLMALTPMPIRLCEEEITALLEIIKTGERITEPIKENETVQGVKLKEDTPAVVIDFIASSLERFLSMVYCRLSGIELAVDESAKAGDYIRTSRLVSEVKSYLSGHVTEKMSLKRICHTFGVGQTQLMKKFKRECAEGVMEYFTRIKIEYAKELISSSSGSFSEIADRLGFSSANYFSRVFRERVGMTPTEYGKYVSKRRNMIK